MTALRKRTRPGGRSDCDCLSTPAAAKHAGPDAAMAALSYRLDVTFTLKDKWRDGSEGHLKDKMFVVWILFGKTQQQQER